MDSPSAETVRKLEQTVFFQGQTPLLHTVCTDTKNFKTMFFYFKIFYLLAVHKFQWTKIYFLGTAAFGADKMVMVLGVVQLEQTFPITKVQFG